MNWLNILKKEDGAVLVITAAAMVAVLGCTALVVDVGLMYARQHRLSNAVDAAALAAVQDVHIGDQAVIDTANYYIKQNGFDEENIHINIGSDRKSVEITASDTVDFFFAKVLGFQSTKVSARAKAIVSPISGMGGVRPLAIENFPLDFGVQYRLKEGAEGGYNGNFGVVALGGTGVSIYRNNLKYGYGEILRVGDWIPTETGNMPSPTEEGVDYVLNQCSHMPKCNINHYVSSCPRIIPLPIVESLEVDGRSDVKIIGFAMFLLEGTIKSGGKLEVVGRFIRHYGNGEIDETAEDYGLRAVKLVE